MSEEKTIKSGLKKKTKTRILKWAAAFAVVVVVSAFFAVPGFVSSEKGRMMILAKINSSIEGKIDFASLSMSWWRGVKVTDIGFNDGAGRISVKVKKITTKPHYSSILTGGLSLGETEVLEPRVEVNLAHPQVQKQQLSQQEEKSRPIALPIKRVEMIVKDGDLKVTGRGWETFEVAGINSKLTILPLSISSGKLGFTKAEYMGLNIGPTEADVQIENGLLKIAPFSSVVNNGQFNFAGGADFKQKPTLLKTPGPIYVLKDVQINDEVARGLLPYLNPVFGNAARVSGTANFECEKLAIPLAGGTKNDIEVAGVISMNRLRLETSDLLGQILSAAGVSGRGVDITIHPTRFILRSGLLKYDDMQMDVGDNPVNFRGVIGLDKSLDMTVTLPYTTAGKTARVGKEVEGARISLPLRGTVNKPELDLGRLLEGQLRQQLQERLMKELEGVLKK
jgi:hypothetical protein